MGEWKGDERQRPVMCAGHRDRDVSSNSLPEPGTEHSTGSERDRQSNGKFLAVVQQDSACAAKLRQTLKLSPARRHFSLTSAAPVVVGVRCGRPISLGLWWRPT